MHSLWWTAGDGELSAAASTSSSSGEFVASDSFSHDALFGAGHMSRHLMGTRVAGVGTAVFVIFFFLAFCLLLCLVGLRTKARGAIFVMSSAILLIVVLVLLLSPKGPAPPPPPQGYDNTILWTILVLVFVCLGAIMGGLGLLFMQLGTRFYARPLTRRDIEVMY